MAFTDTLRDVGIVGVIRAADAEAAVAVSAALVAGGVRGVEITYSTPGCCRAIAAARERLATAVVGVGTVRTASELRDAHAAGAAFAVSPHLDEELVALAGELGLPYLPGALTPTEVHRAWRLGAAAVKLFPGSAVGPGYVSALRAPLAGVPLVPTGGVSVANMAEWFAAGVVAVGMGGSLTTGSPGEIEEAARAAAGELARIRAGGP